MSRICRSASLIVFFALLAAGPAFTQALTERTTAEERTPASAAYVYIQTHKGVNVYDATSSGILTRVKGSPFATSGQMAGSNGSHLISVGTDDLHSYAIASNGGVGKQVSEIDTQSYAGAQCGNTTNNAAMLDHTGRNLYVQLYGATYEDGGEAYTLCNAWQSYEIAPDGALTFLGDTTSEDGYHGSAFSLGLSTINSTDKFAFGDFYDLYASEYSAFKRESNGLLQPNTSFSEVDPTPKYTYFPLSVAADPTNHLAVLMFEYFAENPPPPQLASYTINSVGGIASTNTSENMPTANVCCSLSMSSSGKLLAVTAGPGGSQKGLQIFHFNGAAPITPFSHVLLPSILIDQVEWDNNNHLYALSYSSGELYVYTVTPTTISEVAGSPYPVAEAYGTKGLVVVPKL